MVLIRGGNSTYPCPKCLIPDYLLSDLEEGLAGTRQRDIDKAQEAVLKPTKEQREQACKLLGIRPVWVYNSSLLLCAAFAYKLTRIYSGIFL